MLVLRDMNTRTRARTHTGPHTQREREREREREVGESLHGLIRSVVGHKPLAPGLKFRPGYVIRMFHLLVRLLAFVSHLGYRVHNSGHKTATYMCVCVRACMCVYVYLRVCGQRTDTHDTDIAKYHNDSYLLSP